MKRCVIVSGAEICDYGFVRGYLRNDDYNIFCDCGLRHKKKLGIEADLIVGDFDSYERPETAVETIANADTIYVIGIRSCAP